MNQKTVSFDDSHFKIEKNILMKCQYENNTYNEEGRMEWVESPFQVGVDVTLYSHQNIKTNCPEAFQITIDDGISGNINKDIKLYHGWRGTTSDISVWAYGRRKITKIAHRRKKIYVTVGKDLHPGDK